MTDVIARRGYRGPSDDNAIDAVHTELDGLWDDATFVPEMDRMTFTTAVIEVAANIVQHALPVAEDPVELGVDIVVRSTLLQAHVSAYNAREPFASDMQPNMPDEEAESGRGLALIEALVTTVTFERQDGTNTWVLTRDSTPGS